jgi:hypothetical protein
MSDWQDGTSGAPAVAVAEGEEGPPQPPRLPAAGGAALPFPVL